MRHLKLLAFLCLVLPNCLFTPSLYAQEQDIISTKALSFFNIYHSYLTVEYNRSINYGFRLNSSLGVILPKDGWSGQGHDSTESIKKYNGKGVRLALEAQFLLQASNAFYHEGQVPYIGVETYFSKYNYISQRLVSNFSSDTRRYNVDSRVLGINATIGLLYFTNERVTMTFSAGLGLRYLTIKNDLDVPVSSLSEAYRHGDRIEPEENGRYWRLAIPLNFKIGFTLF